MHRLAVDKVVCYCVVCSKRIGKYYPCQQRKTCSKPCYRKLVSKLVIGTQNPNYKDGRCTTVKYCQCGKKIDRRSQYCYACRGKYNPSWHLGCRHTVKTKKLIGLKSREKFTLAYRQKMRKRYQGNKKRAINGYTLIKDYVHPNRNSHNDVLEHIKVMSAKLDRPLRKGEIVHHKNFVRDDNRSRNLYLYKSLSQHIKDTRYIFTLVKPLLDLKVIRFSKGKYTMNKRAVEFLEGLL